MADHIQIGDVAPRIQYTGDGSQTVFTYPFPLFTDADMEVYLDQAKQSTGFTVNGAGQSAGGDVTFDAAPGTGVLVTLRRRLAIQRTSDFQESGEFRAKVINDELDYLTAALQQVSDDGERSLRLDATDPTGSLTLPGKTTRADMFLGFDADGDPIATDAAGPPGPTGPAGNMDGSNNLSELTDPAAARSNLELGTAAVLDTGTSANEAVKLDGSARLPAVDGSQLLNLGGDDNARANIVLNAFRIQIQHGLSVLDMVDGIVDQFEDETGVDTANSTNEVYQADGDYYENRAFLIPDTADWQNAGAGMSFSSGGVALAANKAAQSVATYDGDNDFLLEWICGQVGTGDNHHIAVYETDEDGTFTNANAQGGTTSMTDSFRVDDGHTYTGNTDHGAAYTQDDTSLMQLACESGTLKLYQAGVLKYTWATSMSGKTLRIVVGSGSTSKTLNTVRFFDGTANDLNLLSNAVTAEAQPDEAFIVLHQEDVDAVTLNTDLKAWASRDDGTTFTQITLAEEAASFGSAGRILSGSADISGQPSGTSMKYKVTTHNTKALNIHGVGLEWS